VTVLLQIFSYFDSKKILKIGFYLIKLLAYKNCASFFGPPCISVHELSYTLAHLCNLNCLLKLGLIDDAINNNNNFVATIKTVSC